MERRPADRNNRHADVDGYGYSSRVKRPVGIVVGFCAAGVTAAAIVEAYPKLPATVPFHFDIRGRPNSLGPRWLVVTALGLGALPPLSGVVAAAFTGARTAEVALTASLYAFIVHLVLGAARRPGQRLDNRSFWFGVTLFLAAIFTVSRAR